MKTEFNDNLGFKYLFIGKKFFFSFCNFTGFSTLDSLGLDVEKYSISIVSNSESKNTKAQIYLKNNKPW